MNCLRLRLSGLMPDYQAAQAQYFRDTQIYPIMHALVIKTAVLDQHPWVAMTIFPMALGRSGVGKSTAARWTPFASMVMSRGFARRG